MRTFSHSFGAGETKQFPSGVHFELITAGDGVNVTYKKNGTDLNEKATNVTSGYFFTMPKMSKPIYDNERKIVTGFRDEFDTFDLVEVYSATAQTVVIGITLGDGGSRSTATSLIGGTIDTLGDITPKTLVSSWSSVTGTSALQTIVAPASNVNGIIIHGCMMIGSADFGRFMSKTSAPTSWNDVNARSLAVRVSSSTAPYGNMQAGNVFPIIIPAGEGLYYQQSGTNTGLKSVNYEVL